METLGALTNCKNSLRLIRDDSSKVSSIVGIPIHTLGDDRIRITDNVYDLTREIYKALSSTSYNGKTMKDENDTSMMNNFKRDSGYTGIGDRSSNRKIFFRKTLPELVEKIQNKTFD